MASSLRRNHFIGISFGIIDTACKIKQLNQTAL